jgi:hypothetical protein
MYLCNVISLNLKITVFWYAVESGRWNRRFGGTLTIYQTIRYHALEDSNLLSYRRENLKSHIPEFDFCQRRICTFNK